MRRWMIVAALLLSGRAEAQSCNGCGIVFHPPGGAAGLSSSGTAITSTLPLLLPNGTAGAPSLSWSADPDTGFYKAGLDFIDVSLAGTVRYRITATSLSGLSTQALGAAAAPWAEVYTSLGFQGGRSKALTGGSATTFLRVAVAQTAAANYGGGSVGYTVYATDGTDSQSLAGDVRFAMVNKAGTETCTIGEVGTPVLAVSSGGSTLSCTFTCATAAADTVDLAANCASSLVETTFTIEYRGDMQKTNTYTPQ